MFRTWCCLASRLPRHVETSLGDCSLWYDLNDQSLWIGGETISTVAGGQEWFGFGSGDFVDGATAKDVLTDPAGRWYRFCLEGACSEINLIFESDRKLGDDLKNLQVWNKAVLITFCLCVACLCILNPVLLSFATGADDEGLPRANGRCRGNRDGHGSHQGR